MEITVLNKTLAVLILAVTLLPTNANAGQAVLSWTHPTTRVNGDALSISEIAATRIEYSTCTGANVLVLPILGTGVVPAPAATTTLSSLTNGLGYCFQAKTVAVDGSISVASAAVSRVIPISPPNPPTITTVTTVAYEQRGIFNKYLVRVGTVELFEPCGKVWRSDESYARLNKSQVNITKRYRGGKLYGECA